MILHPIIRLLPVRLRVPAIPRYRQRIAEDEVGNSADMAVAGLARLRGLAAQECDFECCAREQAIELMGLVLARIAGMGCSEDLPYSPGRVSASRFVPSCFCGTPDGTRMARRTSIGTLSRIGVSTMAGWCSDRFCIWERSIRRRPPLGVKRSRYSTRRPESRER